MAAGGVGSRSKFRRARGERGGESRWEGEGPELSGGSGGERGDDLGEVGNVAATWDSEARAQIVPEEDAVLGAGLHEPEEVVAAVAAGVASGSAADLAFFDLATDVVLGAVGVQWDIGPLEHHQQFAFVGALTPQQAVELGESASVAEDVVEPGR